MFNHFDSLVRLLSGSVRCGRAVTAGGSGVRALPAGAEAVGARGPQQTRLLHEHVRRRRCAP